MMNKRMFEAVALLVFGCGLLVWSTWRWPIQIAQMREQARMAISEVLSGSSYEGLYDPIALFQASLLEDSAAHVQVRRSVYVPAYSTIRMMSGRARIDLATTLSIHNTSSDRALVLERVDYHDTDGRLIQSYLDAPVTLKPHGAIEMFVASDDRRAGMGANFVVDWAADGPISEPVIEAVMIGRQGGATYSFVSAGRPTRIVQPE
jgi:hypothetical protein